MKRFLFSTKAGLVAESILKGLAQAHMITATTCVVVCTEDVVVAALLEKLDTAEQIETVVTALLTPASKATRTTGPEPKVRKPRQQYTGPLVECKACHQMKAPGHMTKAGICKVCHMRELRAAKLQPAKKSQNTYGRGQPPKPEFGPKEYLVNIQSKPKDKINLAKLAGRKVT
jgi:hypothetical protein